MRFTGQGRISLVTARPAPEQLKRLAKNSLQQFELSLADSITNERKRHDQLIAHLCIVMAVVTIGYFFLNLFFLFTTPWYIFAALCLSSFVSFALNRKGKQLAAKIFGLTTFNLIIYSVASSETHLTNVNLYFATAGIAALILFDYNEKTKSFFFIGLSAALYALTRFSPYSPLPQRGFSPGEITFISIANLIVFAYVTTYLIILLLKSNFTRKENLVNQNQELLKINNELDHFIYSSSHDLRAPLSSMLGLIQLSELEKDESAKLEYLKMMRGRIATMELFIKEIIDYAKNARQEIVVEEINIKEVIHSVIDELKYMDGLPQATISCHDIDNMLIVNDRMRLRIVISNLISNAIKYRDVSKPKPELQIIGSTGPTGFNLEFKDNGIGIESDHHDKIFAMFYRAHEISNGAGLGLYLVRESLNSLGGSIKIVSKANEGSSFIVTLPNRQHLNA